MFSIVATETSVLTFVSVPGIAYRGNWFFLQLAFGYIVGRVLVSRILLPLYFSNNIVSLPLHTFLELKDINKISTSKIKKMLENCIEDEDYEMAARLRDELNYRKKIK